jgi:hypothetical protein
MFIEVSACNLVKGEKYMIHSSTVMAYHTGKFDKHEGWQCQLFYDVVYYGSIKIRRGYVYMEPNRFRKIHYYALVPQKERIQQAMEQRALDTILKRLINDDFSW